MSISGKATKGNLDKSTNYAKGNSYGKDPSVKRNLGMDGWDQDLKEGLPPLPRQRDSEGKGYAPIERVTQRNTYTTNDGGTKRS